MLHREIQSQSIKTGFAELLEFVRMKVKSGTTNAFFNELLDVLLEMNNKNLGSPNAIKISSYAKTLLQSDESVLQDQAIRYILELMIEDPVNLVLKLQYSEHYSPIQTKTSKKNNSDFASTDINNLKLISDAYNWSFNKKTKAEELIDSIFNEITSTQSKASIQNINELLQIAQNFSHIAYLLFQALQSANVVQPEEQLDFDIHEAIIDAIMLCFRVLKVTEKLWPSLDEDTSKVARALVFRIYERIESFYSFTTPSSYLTFLENFQPIFVNAKERKYSETIDRNYIKFLLNIEHLMYEQKDHILEYIDQIKAFLTKIQKAPFEFDTDSEINLKKQLIKAYFYASTFTTCCTTANHSYRKAVKLLKQLNRSGITDDDISLLASSCLQKLSQSSLYYYQNALQFYQQQDLNELTSALIKTRDTATGVKALTDQFSTSSLYLFHLNRLAIKTNHNEKEAHELLKNILAKNTRSRSNTL